MLSRALKMAFWVTYDHLGKLVLLNLLCALVFIIPAGMAWAALISGDAMLAVAIGLPLALLACGLVLPVSCVGFAHLMKVIIESRDAGLGDFFLGVRRYAWRAVGASGLFIGAVTCLCTSVWFYAAQLGAARPWLGYSLSALALWCLLFSCAAALLVMPALVQKRSGVFSVWKLCMLLTLDNPLFCMGLAVYALMLGAFCLLPPVFMCFSMAPMMALSGSAYEILTRKYAAIEAARASGGTASGRLKIDFRDEEDDFLNRGFRDFLFPWKS